MLNILTITGPIYLSIGLGYAATRRGMFSKLDGQVLGRFVCELALKAGVPWWVTWALAFAAPLAGFH